MLLGPRTLKVGESLLRSFGFIGFIGFRGLGFIGLYALRVEGLGFRGTTGVGTITVLQSARGIRNFLAVVGGS